MLVMLYITSLVLTHLIAGSLYFLTAFILFPLPHSLPLVTTNLIYPCHQNQALCGHHSCGLHASAGCDMAMAAMWGRQGLGQLPGKVVAWPLCRVGRAQDTH